MSDAQSFAELDGQQVELLPARTVLSMFAQGLEGAPGAPGVGTIGATVLGIPVGDNSGNGIGGAGGDAHGGAS